MCRPFTFLCLLFACSFLLTTGCSSAPKHYDDPHGTIADPMGWPERKMAALQQLKEESVPVQATLKTANPGSPEYREAEKFWDKYIATLHKCVWDRGYPAEVRAHAIDELLAIDEEDFREKLRRRVVLIHNPETVEHIFNIAVEQKWQSFNRELVKRYAVQVWGVPDDDRKEKGYIEKLNPGKSVTQVAFEVFTDADGNTNTTEQTAAWQLLCRIGDQQQLIKLLADAPPKTALITDLKVCAADLGVLPRTQPELAWMMYLRDPSRKAYWNSVRDVVQSLNASQRENLMLRHLNPLLHTTPKLRSMSREQLISIITTQMQQTEHYLRGPEYDGPMRDYPQRFSHAVESLSWGDLLTIIVLREAVTSQAAREVFFKYADIDVRDKLTEYGGRIYADETGKFKAENVDPQYRKHDFAYLSSKKLHEAMYTSLAHYHFHAQNHRNADYAGPGVGDMKVAKIYRFNYTVLTFINENRMNFDLYLPNGTVVDLGSIERP